MTSRPNSLPRLRNRLTATQKAKRHWKIQRRRLLAEIKEGVRMDSKRWYKFAPIVQEGEK